MSKLFNKALKKFGENLLSSLKKKKKKSTFKNPPDLPADFVSYVQFSSFSYLTFTKQGQDAAVLITCSILSVAYELLWTKHKANTI